MLADTHIHIWDFERAAYAWLQGNTTILNRNYRIDELEAERKEAGITKGILVQAANNLEDTRWMMEVAERTDWVAGVVGWLPLMQPDATEKLLHSSYCDANYFKAVRHLIHDEPDAKWLLQAPVIESLKLLAAKNIPYDVVGILPAHIETALHVAEQVPDLRMVFDHLNQPPIATNEKFGTWGSLMKEAAALPNFHVKISGLGLTAQLGNNWSASDIQPYIEFVLEHYGADRIFCGGDWPVSLLAGSYTHTFTQYKQVVKHIADETAQHKIFYANAASFYSF